jgi:hypothetical protein
LEPRNPQKSTIYKACAGQKKQAASSEGCIALELERKNRFIWTLISIVNKENKP